MTDKTKDTLSEEIDKEKIKEIERKIKNLCKSFESIKNKNIIDFSAHNSETDSTGYNTNIGKVKKDYRKQINRFNAQINDFEFLQTIIISNLT